MPRLQVDIVGPPFDSALRAVEAFEYREIHRDDRIQILGGAFVIEALRPYWQTGLTAAEAHESLYAAEPELALIVESLAPLLLRRELARQDAAEILRELERLFNLGGETGERSPAA